MLGNLIGGFITIIVGVNLVPSVADNVLATHGNYNDSYNVSGAAATIVGLTTLFFVLGVAASGIGVAAMGLKNAGLLGR